MPREIAQTYVLNRALISGVGYLGQVAWRSLIKLLLQTTSVNIPSGLGPFHFMQMLEMLHIYSAHSKEIVVTPFGTQQTTCGCDVSNQPYV
jgi:hypothetical protein